MSEEQNIPENIILTPSYDPKIIEDKQGNVFVRVTLLRGHSYVQLEEIDKEQLRMLRLKIHLSNNIKLEDKHVKDILESIDVDFDMVDAFLRKHFKGKEVLKMLSDIRDRFFEIKVGDPIGDITFPYDTYIEFVNWLKWNCWESR